MTQAPAPPAAITCVRHGLNWRIDWRRRSVRVRNSVGMRRLTVLLNNPGAEIHALDLAGTLHSRGEGTPTGRGQPVLDHTALSQYRLRIAQLTAEIDEHQARNDHVGTARLQVEYDWLLDELSAVTGIGGQVRDFADRGERARIAVGKTIRRALANITTLDRELGEHLRDNVHTGTRCSYWPPPDTSQFRT
ncbi:hypothetical protein [Amycolatopsis balhimycina]|nr:hypothetical protein [Amycolatopsis balhimycina]